MRRKKTVFGACNLCGSERELCADHVPPKGCGNITQVEHMELTQYLRSNESVGLQKQTMRRGRIEQNGVKHKTICSDCNNHLLGGKYDRELIGFVNNIKRHLSTRVYTGESIRLDVRPGYLARAVIGHILAGPSVLPLNGSYWEPLASYVLDENAVFPDNFDLYFWLNPLRGTVLLRCMSLHWFNSKSMMLFDVLKFFPVSFVYVHDESGEYRSLMMGRNSLRNYHIENGAVSTHMPIRKDEIVNPYFPEAPADNDNYMVMFNSHLTSSVRPYKNHRNTKRSR